VHTNAIARQKIMKGKVLHNPPNAMHPIVFVGRLRDSF
jgi:hypothetical protein